MPKPGIYLGNVVNVEPGASSQKGTPFIQVTVHITSRADGDQWIALPGGGEHISSREYFSLTNKASHEYSFQRLSDYGVTEVDPPRWGDDQIMVEAFEEPYKDRETGEEKTSIRIRPYRAPRGPRKVSEDEKPNEDHVAKINDRFAAFREKKAMVTSGGGTADTEEKDDLPF